MRKGRKFSAPTNRINNRQPISGKDRKMEGFLGQLTVSQLKII
jgi:hypothetical protein